MCISLFKVFNILFRRKVDFSKKKIKYNTWLSNFRSIISQVVTYGKLNAKKNFGKSAIERVFNLEIRHILRSLTQILSIVSRKLKTFQKRMNELEKMMLNLQKNENRESESYPNVSFMSTVNFEREKTLTKSAICTIKSQERRKKLRCDRYIKNLSNLELTQAQINLLSRGLKFIPTPLTNESHIRTQLLN